MGDILLIIVSVLVVFGANSCEDHFFEQPKNPAEEIPYDLTLMIMLFNIAKQKDRAGAWKILREIENNHYLPDSTIAIIKELAFDIFPNNGGAA